MNSFLLGGAATVLPFGKLYGLFDAKWLYIASSIVFNVGSAVCGAAPNMNALIIGRVLAGIGGNGMFMGVMNLMSGMTTPAERPGYLSFVYVLLQPTSRLVYFFFSFAFLFFFFLLTLRCVPLTVELPGVSVVCLAQS